MRAPSNEEREIAKALENEIHLKVEGDGLETLCWYAFRTKEPNHICRECVLVERPQHEEG